MKTITLRVNEQVQEMIDEITPYIKENSQGLNITNSDIIRICITNYWTMLVQKGYIELPNYTQHKNSTRKQLSEN